MANLTETSEFPAGITRIETNEPVVGGEDGVSNRALKQLGNRTRWLRDQITEILGDFARQDGNYGLLRARSTTKADVGLGNVSNFVATSDPLDGSSDKYATAAAVRAVRDLITGSGGGTGTTGGARVATAAADANTNIAGGATGPTATLASLTAAIVQVHVSFDASFGSGNPSGGGRGRVSVEVRVAGGNFVQIGEANFTSFDEESVSISAYSFTFIHIPTAGQTHEYRMTLSGPQFASLRRITAVALR